MTAVELTDSDPEQEVHVGCVVVNAKVSVQYDKSVLDHCEDLSVVLTKDGNDVIVPQTGEGVVTDAWFNIAEDGTTELSYSITGRMKDAGTGLSARGTLELQERDHYKLNVKISGKLSIDTQISVAQIKTENKEQGFNPYE
jgi:hypothetical protein